MMHLGAVQSCFRFKLESSLVALRQPVLVRPGVDIRELGVLLHEGRYYLGGLSVVSGGTAELQGQYTGRCNFNTRLFLLEYFVLYAGLQCSQGARPHLGTQLQLAHSQWHQLIVAAAIEHLKFQNVAEPDLFVHQVVVLYDEHEAQAAGHVRAPLLFLRGGLDQGARALCEQGGGFFPH